MSQSGSYTAGGGGGGTLNTLTGNTGGAVGPSAGNINVVGSGGVTVTGNPGTNTLTISSSGGGGGITTLDGDSGSATGSTVTIAGGSNINTSATSATVTVNLDDTVSISGSMTAGTGFTATTGDVSIVAGNLDLPATSTGFAEGTINFGGSNAIFFYNGGTYIGLDAGNSTVAGIDNIAIGDDVMALVTGSTNVGVGVDSFSSIVGGNSNTGIGTFSLSGLTTGSHNVCVGFNSGALYESSETSNICIGTLGVTGDNTTIRVGDPATHTLAYIAGAYGVTPTNSPQIATIGSDGQLGSQALPATSFTWTDVTGTTQAMAINSGYVADNSGIVTLTLPPTAAFGSVMEIVGSGSGGWVMAQNSGQTVHFGTQNTTTGASGSVASMNQYDSIALVCVAADTDFVIKSSVGNLTVS
jgi:hypothetical protein